ncbi:MAG: MATE family efflux transporter [Clostridia bacterium]|nr:MATE family efflux transporter [Clostridia bacterium]
MRMRFSRDPVFYHKLVHLTAPIAFQSLMLALVAAGDAVMLGRLDQNSMSAVSLATQIQFVQNMLVSSMTAAFSVLGAQYWGKNDRSTMRILFNMTLRLNGLVSLLFSAACLLVPSLLMQIFTNVPELIAIGSEYLRIAGLSYFLTGISQCYLTMMKVTDHAARSAWISSGAVILNILLNAVFIFGLFGMPAMGARGAALATLIARVVELVWALVSSFVPGYLRPDLSRFFHRFPLLSRDFRKVVLPLIGASLLWGIGFTSYTAVMGHMGTDAAAANSVSAVVRDLMCCLCNGLSTAGGIMVGNELGSGNLEKGKLYGNRLMLLSVLCGLSATALVLLVMPFVVRFMSMTDHARSLLRGMLIITSVYMIGRCMNTIIINGIFAAGGDTAFDMYSLVVCMWGLAVPLSFLGAFVFHWSPLLVFSCTCLDEVGKIPWVLAHFRRYLWVRDLTRTSNGCVP